MQRRMSDCDSAGSRLLECGGCWLDARRRRRQEVRYSDLNVEIEPEGDYWGGGARYEYVQGIAAKAGATK